MATVLLTCVSDNFAQENIPIATSLEPNINLTPAERDIQDSQGRTWRASKYNNGYGYIIYKYKCNNTQLTGSDFTAIKDSLGLNTLRGYENAAINGKYPNGKTYCKKDSVGLVEPYYIITSPTELNATFLIRSSGYNVGFNDEYTHCILACPLCVSIDDHYEYGVLTISHVDGGYANTEIIFAYNSNINENTFGMPYAAPGEKGFQPAGNKAHLPTGGGQMSGWKPVYPTDTLTQPGDPDESVASAAGSGFITAYKMNAAKLNTLGEALFGGLLTKLSNIFIDPLDCIISLQVFPCEPTVGDSEYIKLYNYSCKRDVLGVDTSAPKLTKQFKTFDFGTLTVDEMWNSFLDYDATSFELYLPFIGSVDIPVSEVMSGSVNVQYTVDFFTGMCVANVLCTKTITLPDGTSVSQQTQHSYMGNCSVQIPLHKESYASFVGAIANAAASGLRAPVSLVQSAVNGAFKPNIETKGTINANAGYCSILYPYISITRPIAVTPENYQQVMGYPCYIANTLGECEDLTICDNIDLSGLYGATDSEMERVKQLCKDGIYV